MANKKSDEKIVLPKKGKPFWYIIKSMITHFHEVREGEWKNGYSDAFRLANDNVFLSVEDAEDACSRKNAKLIKAFDAMGIKI